MFLHLKDTDPERLLMIAVMRQAYEDLIRPTEKQLIRGAAGDGGKNRAVYEDFLSAALWFFARRPSFFLFNFTTICGTLEVSPAKVRRALLDQMSEAQLAIAFPEGEPKEVRND